MHLTNIEVKFTCIKGALLSSKKQPITLRPALEGSTYCYTVALNAFQPFGLQSLIFNKPIIIIKLKGHSIVHKTKTSITAL